MTKEITTIQKLIIGTNVFEEFNNIFEIGDNLPLIIGEGDVPIVSINIPLNGNWIPIIDKNKSNSPGVGVKINHKQSSINIFTQNITILNAQVIAENTIEIFSLDLRPLGLNIFKTDDTLNIGGMKFTGNTFKNVGTIFSLG